jgi:SAM-dependent methyltransferase
VSTHWPPEAGSIVVVGAGTSTLVDALIDDGHAVVAVDVAAAALETLAARHTARSAPHSPRFVVADVRSLAPDQIGGPVHAWHDRAVLHFLVDDADRAAYVDAVDRCVRTGGHVVVGAFAPDGPDSCSGLPVRRDDAHTLAATFGHRFELLESLEHDHVTPWGTVQRFTHAVLRKR